MVEQQDFLAGRIWKVRPTVLGQSNEREEEETCSDGEERMWNQSGRVQGQDGRFASLISTFLLDTQQKKLRR